MSDFIFQNKHRKENKLSNLLKSIYTDDSPKVFEFRGQWGSLVVSRNPYFGFDPLETKNNIYFVIGGPILTFTDNKFLTGSDSKKGTKKIVEKFNKNTIIWHKDLSGPFVFGKLNKEKGKLKIISDIISFIPVFKYESKSEIALSTHPDLLAQTTKEYNNKDKVSIADFILNGIVTFPYTFYKSIRQIKPASIYTFNLMNYKINNKNEFYWQPVEEDQRTNIKETANELRNDIKSYIKLVTEGMYEVASFISGGEDSRAILALMPDNLKKESFIFLDEMNREGEIAKKVAKIYDAEFNLIKRSKTHYIDILEESSKLVGSGKQYIHAHSFNLYKKCKLDKYPAVFGGLFSDLLIKGSRIKKIFYSDKLPLIPEIKLKSNEYIFQKENNIIDKNIISTLNNRKSEHYNNIKKIRPNTANEWYWIWPASMANSSANIDFNRRLFKSYEPFLSNQVVKTAANVPVNWKMNRKLYHKTMKPLFEISKELKHSRGWYPYDGWFINSFLEFIFLMKKELDKTLKLNTKNQASWGDWEQILKSSIWKNKSVELINSSDIINEIFTYRIFNEFFSDQLTLLQKLNLMQSKYLINNEI